MELKLEKLEYQRLAVQSVVKLFEENDKNTFENANSEGIRFNFCNLTAQQMATAIAETASENDIKPDATKFSKDNDLCIEMETGTGKTLVYIKTICELFKQNRFTKFIILVPSVAIRQGVLSTFKAFEKPLFADNGFKPDVFSYDSKNLKRVSQFVEEQHLQVMVLTLASFNSEDKILNQANREELFANMPFIHAIGKTRPIVIMDEPQEGMDTPNAIERIAKLNPLIKLRYSATHKIVKNLIFRLTPFDSYKQGLVKKIEVLSIIEKNDEATVKIQLVETHVEKGKFKAKLRAWHQASSTNKFDFKVTNWLQIGDNLGAKTNNPSYDDYVITDISKSLKTGKWHIIFSNYVQIFENQALGSIANIWETQMDWLVRRHFEKTEKLATRGIKCLSLIFIDKVANYMGETPLIKNLFVKKYLEIYPEFHNGQIPEPQHIQAVQGYYFAQKSSGEYADTEGGIKEQSKIYELILKGREALLTITNPVQFIFSHSALGVGWDNPNVFNIATLNTAYSEIRKRQEIGRGLRICVNQEGQRIYDALDLKDESERINQLTVIPNESYETFVSQYQAEINEQYGTTSAGAAMSHSHKGKPQGEVTIKRNPSATIDAAFKQFWTNLARKTDYTVVFEENSMVETAIKRMNDIKIPDYLIETSSHFIRNFSEDDHEETFAGKDIMKLKTKFAPLDLVEELSEKTGLSYPTLFKILQGVTNHGEWIKNPPRYVHEAAFLLKNIVLDEMMRGVNYHLTDDFFPFDFPDSFTKQEKIGSIVNTPRKGVYDKTIVDSFIESDFATRADFDSDIVCFLKLPSYYKIKTPIGNYEPDFGIVMKRKSLKTGEENDFYFVVETKGTNDLYDKKALTESEAYKIKCAMKHFERLGVEVHYKAPIKEYPTFKKQADATMDASK
jgi:type III restriction enzyme